MEFSQDNKIVQLCAKGMESEGQSAEAKKLFDEAWNEARTDFEKFTAAHYVARHQKSVSDKLKWDETALQHALNIKGLIQSHCFTGHFKTFDRRILLLNLYRNIAILN
jgi:rifampin ADP-ribosylating transferase